MNLNLPQLEASFFHFAEAPQSGDSMEKNEEIAHSRWNPTRRQKEILKQLFRAGDHNPTRARINEITELLKVHGNVEAKNVFYWFQNAHSREKRKQQRKLARDATRGNNKENEISGSSRTPIRSSPSRCSSGVILEPSIRFAPFWLQNNGGLKQQEQQKKSTQDYSFHQENIAERSKGPLWPSLNNASNNMMWEPAIGMATFPLQRHTNSQMPAFPKQMDTARPNNSPLKQQNGSERQSIFGITLSDIRNKVEQTDRWLRPSKECALCPYTECRLCADGCTCNILIASKAEERENKDELLELFPLHPDGNLRSLTYRDRLANNSKMP